MELSGGSGRHERACKKLRLKEDLGRQKGGGAERATRQCLKIANKQRRAAMLRELGFGAF